MRAVADDDLSDLSDMSGLGAAASSTPTPRPVDHERPGSRPGSDRSPWAQDESAVPPPAGRGGCGLGAVAALVLAVGLGVVAAVVALRAGSSSESVSDPLVVETTAGLGEQIDPPSGDGPASTDLFGGGLGPAYDALLEAAGRPDQVLELTVYDTYAFLAYRDPGAPGNIDRRMWRDGEVGPAEPNPIADRADEPTLAELFDPAELDPALVTRLVADAPARYEDPVEVTHVIVDRFLPFDERVLIRVYAAPTDGRSGGGYVSYDPAGALVGVCC